MIGDGDCIVYGLCDFDVVGVFGYCDGLGVVCCFDGWSGGC